MIFLKTFESRNDFKGIMIFKKNYAKKQYSSGLSSENSEITKSEVP